MEEASASAAHRSNQPTKRFEKDNIAKFSGYLEFAEHSQLNTIRNGYSKLVYFRNMNFFSDFILSLEQVFKTCCKIVDRRIVSRRFTNLKPHR